MQLADNKKLTIFLWLMSVLLSIFITFRISKIRAIGYDLIPSNEIFDERDYALQGLSLRKTGIPIGWSMAGPETNDKNVVQLVEITGLTIKINGVLPNFQNARTLPFPVVAVGKYDFGFGDQYVKFIIPFIGHPPLGGIITSIFIPKSVNDFSQIKPIDYRKAPLYLAIITSILLYIYLAQTVKNPWVPLIAVVIYNTVPSYFFGQRYALLENIISPISLAILNLVLIYNRYSTQKKNTLSNIIIILLGLTGGLIFLVKETGISFVFTTLIILYFRKANFKRLLLLLTSTAIPILVYLIWMICISPSALVDIFLFHLSRGFYGSLNFLSILPALRLKDFPFDGWWIWGFISVFYIAIKWPKKYYYILLPFFLHLAVIIFMSGSNYPYYYLSLVPYFAALAACTLYELFKAPNIPLSSAFFLIPFSSSFYWGYTVFHLPPSSVFYRLLLIVFAATLYLRSKISNKILRNIIWISFCLAVLIEVCKWNTYSLSYILANWQNLPYPSLPQI